MPDIDRRNMLLATGVLGAALIVPEAQASPTEVRPPSVRVPRNVRMRGSNIVCTGSPLGQPWQNYGSNVWSAMWSTWEWEDWIKPQIDDAAAIGNSVRLFGSVQTFLEGNITQDTYFERWQQMLDYCASKGLFMLPSGSDLQDQVQILMTSTQAAAHYSNWSNMLAEYPGVVGIDLMNEAWGLAVNGHVDNDWLLPVLRACTDAVHSEGLAAAPSFPVFDSSLWSWSPFGPDPAGRMFEKFPVEPFFELADYLDIHLYVTSSPAQLAFTSEKAWAAGKPIIFGEFGIGADQPSSARTEFYTSVKQLVTARSDIVGALAWSCYDVNSGENRFGLYSAPGKLRTDIATPFADFPTQR